MNSRDSSKKSFAASFQCPVCKLHYQTKELAKKCQAWCAEHKSCNLEIIKFAIKE